MAHFSKGFTFGLLAGAIAGSVTAILIAPDKGSNTRSRVTYHIQTYIDEIRSLINELQDEKFAINTAKQQNEEAVEDAKKKAENLLREAEDLLTNISKEK